VTALGLDPDAMVARQRDSTDDSDDQVPLGKQSNGDRE
jgi:hypothetical protein